MTNKLLIALTILSLLTSQSLSAQIPMIEWAHSMGGPTWDSGQSIAIDASGNVYTIGDFTGTVDFDPGPETFILTSAGEADIFIQKLDANGNFLWVKQIGGVNEDFGQSIAIDDAGNVYTTGYFWGTVDFNPGEGTAIHTAVGDWDIYIQKLDTDGNFLWAKQMGGALNDFGHAIAVDNSGNVYTTGAFLQTVDFNTAGEGTEILTSAGQYDVFIQKLDTDGNFVWVKQVGGTSFDLSHGIAVDASNNIYVTGFYRGNADYDPGPETYNLDYKGGDDIFVLKLDAEGNFVWAKSMGGWQYDYGYDIAVDSVGNVYTTGRFEGESDFDPGPDTYNLTSEGLWDIFVQKLDPNGNFLWAKSMGATQWDQGRSIALDASANVYTTGSFRLTVDFDPGPDTLNLTSAGIDDIYIQKLDTDGNFIWAKQIGAESRGIGTSIALDASDNIYVTGYFEETVNFDPGSESAILTSAGGPDIFVMKLSQCYPTIAPIPNVLDLPNLTAMCELTILDAPAPIASDNCDITITASPDQTFPITDQSITEIVWTYDDGAGNVLTQNQNIIWTPIDITTSITDYTITANNSDATYQWLDCDNNNTPISGENDQSFTASANGNYAVEISQNGCVENSECVSITTVGINEFERNFKVAVYPNPSSGIFNIAFEKPIDHATLTITDVQGKLISTTQIQNTSKTGIEINEASGVYLLTIKSKDGQKTNQLIKY